MEKFLKLLVIGALINNLSCSSGKKEITAEDKPEVVLSRSNSLSERPDWLDETSVEKHDDGFYYFLGNASIPGDHRVESGFRIAEMNAKRVAAAKITQKFDSSAQYVQEGTNVDNDQFAAIMTEFTENLEINGLSGHKRYWEKVAVTKDNGRRVTEFRLFVITKISDSDYLEAGHRAMDKSFAKHNISKELAEKAKKRWDAVVGESRTPATKEPSSETSPSAETKGDEN